MARHLKTRSLVYGFAFLILPCAFSQNAKSLCKSYGKQCPSVDANVTLVTSLYDIGRSQWDKWQRPMSEYLSYFKHVLSLNIPMVVFVDEEHVSFVEEARKRKQSVTKIYKKPFNELEYFKYRPNIKAILKSEIFREDNEMLKHPEAFSADYLIMTNNKISFVEKVAQLNPFKTMHFYWLDAGYGHGTVEIFPKSGKWSPCNLLCDDRLITYIRLNPVTFYEEIMKAKPLHKHAVDPALNGGFFGGGQRAVTEYAKLFRKVFRSSLTKNEVDDDQGTALQCYFELPRLFNLVTGDWYDVFRLFN